MVVRKHKTTNLESLRKPDFQGAVQALETLAGGPKKTPLQTVVEQAKPMIIQAFHRGYSRQEICNRIQQFGIHATPRMLLRYVPELRGSDQASTKASKPRTTKAALADAAESTSAIAPKPRTSRSSAKPRSPVRRRTTARA